LNLNLNLFIEKAVDVSVWLLIIDANWVQLGLVMCQYGCST